MANPEEIFTIEQLEKEVESVYLLADKGIVKMVCATVIANRLDLDAVWLLLVAPSSSGKTELIQACMGLDFLHPISDLTTNTFASGMKKTAGKEISLLHKMGNGIMVFKDFTSIMSKNKDAKKEIMSQLREIYDGSYVKRTGNGEDITWTGKLGALAGSTEAIYSHMEDMSSMGDRFVMYSVDQPDRIEVSLRALNNTSSIHEKRIHIQKCFTHYINHVIEKTYSSNNEIVLDHDTKIELLKVADFATRSRSAVIESFKTGLIEFVPSAEMPMRVVSQLYTIATAFMAMKAADPNNSHIKMEELELTELDKKLLYKTAFDSIPKSRRNALKVLAKYERGVTSKGMATYVNLPTQSVARFLYQLNALGICSRQSGTGPLGDKWKIKDEYRPIVLAMENIKSIDEELRGTETEEMGEEQFVKSELSSLEQEALTIAEVVYDEPLSPESLPF